MGAKFYFWHLNLIGRSNERGFGSCDLEQPYFFVIESNTRVDVEYQVLTAASPVSI